MAGGRCLPVTHLGAAAAAVQARHHTNALYVLASAPADLHDQVAVQRTVAAAADGVADIAPAAAEAAVLDASPVTPA
jgi:hypothetical protein